MPRRSAKPPLLVKSPRMSESAGMGCFEPIADEAQQGEWHQTTPVAQPRTALDGLTVHALRCRVSIVVAPNGPTAIPQCRQRVPNRDFIAARRRPGATTGEPANSTDDRLPRRTPRFAPTQGRAVVVQFRAVAGGGPGNPATLILQRDRNQRESPQPDEEHAP